MNSLHYEKAKHLRRANVLSPTMSETTVTGPTQLSASFLMPEEEPKIQDLQTDTFMILHKRRLLIHL
jgi:hypothetical protein